MRPGPTVLFLAALIAIAALVGRSLATEGDDPAPTTVVVAEGTGRDEKEARAAALRDAVSRVVGSLVDAETLVRNDRVIREQVLEFSGGFVRTYDPLGTETLPGGLVRVRIKATVERLRVAEKLAEAKVTISPVRGADLLAERMTKDEARKNATELLAKLYADLPKLAIAEVKGKPRLSADRTALLVDVDVSVDTKVYAAFVDRAAALLDKVAVHQSRGTFAGKLGGTILVSSWEERFPDDFGFGRSGMARGVVKTPAHLLGQEVVVARIRALRDEPGYGVWLLTASDGRAERLRWTECWVDADWEKSTRGLAAEPVTVIELVDARGKVVASAERSVVALGGVDGFGWYHRRADAWFVCSRFTTPPPRPRELGPGAPAPVPARPYPRALTIAPLAMWADAQYGNPALGFAPAVRVSACFKLTDDELGRVTAATAKVEYRR